MHKILIIGAGKIGSLIAFLLSHSNDYAVTLADNKIDNTEIKKLGRLKNFSYTQLDAKDLNHVSEYIKNNKIEAIISSLPFYVNPGIAKVAAENHVHYFDLTEDVETTEHVKELSKNSNSIFVPQCGIAPGFISIVANDLMQHFPKLDTVKLRVGALPINISNALQYSLTWSTDGLINEYGNPCLAVLKGEKVILQPLEGLEHIKIDGLTYEAFNTSGGVGSLVQSYEGKIKDLNYKTIRYPGHCAKIKFLMNDLRLNENREALKTIFEHAIPKTLQDVVLVYVSVTGMQDEFIEESYVKKFYPKRIQGVQWSAIQLTTASSLCTVVDLVMTNPDKYQGLVLQEQIPYDDFVKNRFGKYFEEE